MLTTRRVDSTLQKVTPISALLIVSMPCEQKAAGIRNQTVDYMNDDNIAAVAYKYLQSKEGKAAPMREIAGYVFTSLFALWKSNKTPHLYWDLYLSFVIPFTLAIIAIDIGNMKRYRETESGCEQWLNQKVGQKSCQEISALRKDYWGKTLRLIKLAELLEQKDVDVTFLKKKGYSSTF